MSSTKQVPSLRFIGFTDAWEQRKLGSFCKIDIGEFVIRTKQRDDAPYPVYNGGSSYTGFYDDFNQEGKKVIVSARGANAGFVNKCATPYWAGNSCYSIGVLDDTDWVFLYHAIKHVQLEFIKGQQSANIPSVSKEQVQKTEVACPSYPEQKKIAVFLEDLDDLITLHQRKYEKLVSIKKSMLEKMFPKNGERVPEVRFSGYTDAWEQCKLGELVDRVVRKNSNNESTLPLTISAQYGLVDQITYFNNRVASRDVSNYYLVLNGEFAYNKSSSDGFPYGTVKRLDLYDMGVLSTLYIVFSIKDSIQLDSNFLTVYFDTNRWHKGVSERAAEGARNHGLLNISAEDFLDIEITIPKEEREQAAIGIVFENINNLITLHQRKYERLQNLKKAYLERMFV